MDILSCVRFIGYIFEALKVFKTVKKVVVCVMVVGMIIVGVTGILENQSEIKKAYKKLKKKVI